MRQSQQKAAITLRSRSACFCRCHSWLHAAVPRARLVANALRGRSRDGTGCCCCSQLLRSRQLPAGASVTWVLYNGSTLFTSGLNYFYLKDKQKNCVYLWYILLLLKHLLCLYEDKFDAIFVSKRYIFVPQALDYFINEI